ncbi:uncharacterized protein LOC131152662 [Malania oleifera]|uniref:uncharacterized protein LOC131152662 n=1 Tax=Malania oleifera TaxID=397392 RepID=UPI0025AE6909|nr:uncharacterized protein LOC131152662 [Malania oleifera]XP_057960434.1 uncharacterized protein LOC131152662 [Malania oleifera]
MASYATAAMSLLAPVLAVAMLAIYVKGFEDLSPILSPYYDKICEEVECGKGSCKAGLQYPFNFICECDSGWKRTRLDDDGEHHLRFLPCVIPNCSMDYSCMPAPAPVPPFPSVPHNVSFFDPCYWMYCGEGTCIKNKTTYTYTCECKAGYSNLLNISVYPCFSDCTIGSDCARLGIKVANSSSTTTSPSSITSTTTSPSSITPGGNEGTSFLPGKLHWIAILIMCVAMVL